MMVIGDEAEEPVQPLVGPTLIDPSKDGHIHGIKEGSQGIKQPMGRGRFREGSGGALPGS